LNGHWGASAHHVAFMPLIFKNRFLLLLATKREEVTDDVMLMGIFSWSFECVSFSKKKFSTTAKVLMN
jgi:hypothetical protein